MYSGPKNIVGIALAYEMSSFSDIKDASRFGYTSTSRTPKTGELATLVNQNSFFAAVKLGLYDLLSNELNIKIAECFRI